MNAQSHQYTINIEPGSLRAFITAMREEGQFSEYFDTGFSETSFWIKEERTEERPGYLTRIIIRPQENSVRLTIKNEFREGEEFPVPFLAWDKIRADLERSGFKIMNGTVGAPTGMTALDKRVRRRRPGDLAEWALKVALRLAMLKEPGVYDVQLIVRPDKTRELIIRNAERPHKLEHLGAS